MKKTTRHILGVAGVIAAVVGTVLMSPSVLSGHLAVTVGATLLLVLGLVLLAISFGD